MVKTGYKVYADGELERPIEAATGIEIEVMWDCATAITAIGVALASTLYF